MTTNRSSSSEPMSFEQIEWQLGNSLWNSMMLAAGLLTPISLARAFDTGWLPLYTIHAAVLVAMLVMHALRHWIPMPVRKGVALAYLFLMGCQSLFTMGMLGFGGAWLSLTCYLLGMVYGLRAGIACVVLSVGLMAGAMFQFTHGGLQVPVDPNLYVRSTGAWVLALAMMLVMPTVLLTTIVLYKQAVVTLLKETEEQRQKIEHLAAHDHLTGLIRESVAQDRLQMAINHAHRSGDKVALLFIDLDGFKQVNDKLGHGAGDRVLCKVAHCIRGAIRSSDTAARVGGDEFLVILDGLKSDEVAGRVAARLVEDIGRVVASDADGPSIGASIGVALFPDHGADTETLTHAADLAMYEAKRGGTSRIGYAKSSGPDRGSSALAATG